MGGKMRRVLRDVEAGNIPAEVLAIADAATASVGELENRIRTLALQPFAQSGVDGANGIALSALVGLAIEIAQV
jgi:hypothetical protein